MSALPRLAMIVFKLTFVATRGATDLRLWRILGTSFVCSRSLWQDGFSMKMRDYRSRDESGDGVHPPESR